MSKRIAQAYNGFLSYSQQKEAVSAPKKTDTANGLGARLRQSSKQNQKTKYAELDRVAEIVNSIREYRNT